MTKSTLVLVLVAASAIVVATPSDARDAPPSPAPKPSPAAPRSGAAVPAAGVTPVNVVLSGPNCGHRVSPPSANLHRNSHGLLRWNIQNSCSVAKPILLCVYDAKSQALVNPFFPCTPDPNSHDVGKTFPVSAHDHVTFDCTARDDGNYLKQVRVGNEVPPGGCPSIFQRAATVDGKEKLLTHALDITIEP